jgi:peptide/nickel transport system substrate-binding protein
VWHDKRVRQAAILAIDRPAVNEVSCLGFCPPTSIIIPRVMDFALQTPAAPYDPEKAKKLLTEAGYPHGFDAGDFVPMPPFMTTSEACVNFLAAERAAFLTNWREKKLRGIFMPETPATPPAASAS